MVARDHPWPAVARPRGFWLACSYDGTAVTIARQLPATIRYCQVSYERTATFASDLPVIKRIECG